MCFFRGGKMGILIFALPALALIWFVISVIQFSRTSGHNTEKRKSLKVQIIVSASIVLAWVVIIGVFYFLIMYSIAVNGM